MFVIALGLFVTVALGIAVIGIVAVGVGGRLADSHPRVRRFATLTVDHFNGEATPPKSFARLVK